MLSLFRAGQRKSLARRVGGVVPTLRSVIYLVFFVLPFFPSSVLAGVRSFAPDEATLKGTVLVSAASSLTDVFTVLAAQFEAGHPQVRIRLNFGGSAVLATQIERGAPVAVFAAAGRLPFQALLRNKRLAADSLCIFATGELVLVSKQAGVSLAALAESDRLLAVGNPRLAPIGAYAERTLQALSLTEMLRGRLVLGENARQVLRYVETGAVGGGLVYRSDALTSPDLLITEVIPAEVSGRVEYPISATGDSSELLAAHAFVDFVCGPGAREAFLRQGFLPTCQMEAP